MDIFDQIKKKKSDKRVKTKKPKSAKPKNVKETVEIDQEIKIETKIESPVEVAIETPPTNTETTNPWSNETKLKSLEEDEHHSHGESEEWDNDEEVEDVPEFAAMKIGEIKKKEMKRVKIKGGFKMVELDDEAGPLGWGQDNPLITEKDDEDVEEEKEKEEVKAPVVSTTKPKAFVPRARRPGHSTAAPGMRTTGLKRRVKQQQTYKVDDVNSFPTLGTTMSDVKPEGFHSVQTNSYGNRPGHHSNKGLDIQNRFGNLA